MLVQIAQQAVMTMMIKLFLFVGVFSASNFNILNEISRKITCTIILFYCYTDIVGSKCYFFVFYFFGVQFVRIQTGLPQLHPHFKMLWIQLLFKWRSKVVEFNQIV